MFSFYRSKECKELHNLFFVFLVLVLTGCGAPRLDMTTVEGRAAIKDQVNKLLSTGACTQAIDVIEPLYHSEHTDNEVRLLRASAHACNAGIDFFGLVNNLTDASTTLCTGSNCTGVWTTLTQIFTLGTLETTVQAELDRRVRSSWLALDALQAVLSDGIVVPTEYQVNAGSHNVGTLVAADRTDDSNGFLILVSMGLIGANHNRYGQSADAPFDSTYNKTVNLPWTSYDLMDEVGCAYTGAIVNMIDGSDQVSTTFSSGLDSSLSSAIDLACSTSCTTNVHANCTAIASQCESECPLELRHRTSCQNSDVAKCSAIGIVTLLNSGAPAGWPCVSGGCS